MRSPSQPLIRRELVLAQEFSRGEQLIAQNIATGGIDRADLRQPVLIGHCQQCFDRNIRVVEQVRAVAGHQYLAVPRPLAESGQQHAGRCRVKDHFRFLEADQQRPSGPS